MSSKITTTPVKNCAVCKKKIISREYLKCMTCNRFVDVTCTSNITLKFFRIMTNKTKDVWKCHLCTGKGKRTCAVRLQQKTSAEYPPTSLKNNQNAPKGIHALATECTPVHVLANVSTPTTYNNVTIRKKYLINVSTDNSFQSLSDDDVLDDVGDTINTSACQLNMSCPVGGANDSNDLTEMNEKVELLQYKLGSAEAEIDNLLAENFQLQKKIAEQELKIEKLTRICKTPIGGNRKRTKNISKSLNVTDASLIQSLNTSQDLGVPAEPEPIQIPDSGRIDLQKEGDTHNMWHAVEQSHSANNNTWKHRVLILADETGRGLRNILQKRLGQEYHVTSSLKPYASLEHVLLNSYVQCQDFTKSDYIVILAGSHDNHLVGFQSSLYYHLNVLNNTNLLFGQIGTGNSLRGHKFDRFLNSLDSFFDNLHYSQIFYFNKSILDKDNTCRSLMLDILKIGHRNLILNNKKKTVYMSNDNINLDRFFFRNY